MAGFSSTYTDEQRAAVATAYLGGIRPAQAVADLAARGELVHGGKRLPAFEVRAGYVRSVSSELQRRRLGLARSGFDQPTPRDVWESILARAARVAEAEIAALEMQREGKRDIERLRKLVQAARAAQRFASPGVVVGASDSTAASGLPATSVGGSLMQAHLASPAGLSVVPTPDPIEPAPVAAPVESEAARVRSEIEAEIRAAESGSAA